MSIFHNEMCSDLKLLAVKRWIWDLKLGLLANRLMCHRKASEREKRSWDYNVPENLAEFENDCYKQSEMKIIRVDDWVLYFFNNKSKSGPKHSEMEKLVECTGEDRSLWAKLPVLVPGLPIIYLLWLGLPAAVSVSIKWGWVVTTLGCRENQMSKYM